MQVPVVVRTSNMKISRRRLPDYVKTLHQRACRTCSTINFPQSTNQIMICDVVVAVASSSNLKLLVALVI